MGGAVNYSWKSRKTHARHGQSGALGASMLMWVRVRWAQANKGESVGHVAEKKGETTLLDKRGAKSNLLRILLMWRGKVLCLK